jgi:hypothetical protein
VVAAAVAPGVPLGAVVPPFAAFTVAVPDPVQAVTASASAAPAAMAEIVVRIALMSAPFQPSPLPRTYSY